MIASGWSRIRRQAVWAAVAVLAVALLPLHSAAAQQGSTAVAKATSASTRLTGFSTARASVLVGGELWSTVTVGPRAARPVTVQYRRAGTRAFRDAATWRSSPSGVVTLGLRPPAAGTWQFRAVVAATTSATKFVSRIRTVVASGRAHRTSIRGFETTEVTVRPGGTVADDVVIGPRASRIVAVQVRTPGSTRFVRQSTLRSTANGNLRVVFRPTAVGVWGYRIVVRASATALPRTSPVRIITADDTPGSDRTAPGPVSGLSVSGRTDRTATLLWTNPAEADVTGVVIRRTLGAAAPASVTDGSSVTDVPTPGRTFTDAGLAPDTQYTYAAFAHDGAHNYAAPATVTLTTASAPVGADSTAPQPVTHLRATSVSRTTVALAWTNPGDADLTGAVVRRAVGGAAPASPTDGTAVSDVPAPGNTFTDAGLTMGTTYSYAVFAHDGGPHYAAADTLTVTTAAPVTEAVLAVRVLGRPTSPSAGKVTAGTPFAFDASDSVAADGASLQSGSLNYGDGETFAFTQLWGPLDFWNTVHTYTDPGPKTVTLTVTDSKGTTDHTSVTVDVLGPLTASLAVAGGPYAVGVPVTFSMTSSTPATTQVTSYALVVSGDESFHVTGSTAPPPTQDITFTLPGTYTVVLQVRNDAGSETATTKVDVVVAAAP